MGTHQEELARYMAELASVEAQIKELIAKRTGLAQVVAGLRVLTGEITVAAERQLSEPPPSEILSEGTTLDAAVEILRGSKRIVLPASQISQRLEDRGRTVNYQTLYQALRREADKPDGRVFRHGDSFGLREWKSTGYGVMNG